MKITIDVARNMEHGEGWSAAASSQSTGKSYTGSGPDLPALCAFLAREVGRDAQEALDAVREHMEREYDRQARRRRG